MSETNERLRYEVQGADDVEQLCAGDVLNVKFEIKISIPKNAIFSEKIFQSFIDYSTREFLRKVCYERDS